ncbi:uncharacterized protein FIBRA_05434 [Fibroporia radiculosa]|uniref:Uncharacterized protein n=1 Tax=Fibroporia radiculosa TaxID=599839 RepID=J4IAQ2_9APHY|nr:uncharacterized protein FIBRA_05434 [Fibroporia radiculosa]CCM03306.1 predicted protein [Fibroporia radiculosa]
MDPECTVHVSSFARSAVQHASSTDGRLSDSQPTMLDQPFQVFWQATSRLLASATISAHAAVSYGSGAIYSGQSSQKGPYVGPRAPSMPAQERQRQTWGSEMLRLSRSSEFEGRRSVRRPRWTSRNPRRVHR